MKEYTLGQRIVLNRWKLMAETDLGSMVQPVARDLYRFFAKAYEQMNAFGEDIEFDASQFEDAVPVLRGYECNDNEDILNVVTTHDLNYVHVLKASLTLDNLDFWLMNDRGWYSRYLYSLDNK